MTLPLLRRISLAESQALRRTSIDAQTEAVGAEIVAAVRAGGVDALRGYAERFDGLAPGAPIVYERAALFAARDALAPETRALLERTANRIAAFARAQRESLRDLDISVEGGRAGHSVLPVDRAGCYAPAGRFPLPSTLLMTAVTARVAGVREVIVATPKPSPLMLGAAAIAGADMVLAAGGAQSIGAMAWGVAVPPCDVIVGPGSRWVTAGKKAVAGHVAIDMLAGPSELVVVADASADPAKVAADLLAQAEHDSDAFPALVAIGPGVVEAVERQLVTQLESLPTRGIAVDALRNGVAIVCESVDEAVRACDALAPEHLQLCVRDADSFAPRCRTAGAVFIGEMSAEVFGDYGIGGNHVLPTGRGARFTGGLSVLTFLRVRTWLRMDDASGIVNDVAALARLEGLEGHARAAEVRR
jgi:histidinol dehydrogenase